eukprot:CAMPEP_0173420562 /NCGR_PEP_ID=MMETSP1357-20121228/1990_1 /TAXON_ID=77926 /ORGANISM="Hemiselmis rufescens, Strain PCC563" /LENGTH=255 /DNA_ID=CAMNT_0014383361 /DNA_START=51 /DNA_END=816 /DNA_ORIENTATION=+
MSNITLKYFDGGGRGEAIRIALWHGGIQFTDERFTYDQWKEIKPTIPGGAVPVLEVDGKTFTQSAALLRYAGRRSGLYPEDLVEAMRCDEVLDIVSEVLTKTPQDADVEVKKAKRAEYAAGPMKGKMGLLGSYAEQSGPDGFIAGKSFTIADLVLESTVGMFESGNFDHVASDYCEQWPALVALAKRIRAHDIVAKWAASKAKETPAAPCDRRGVVSRRERVRSCCFNALWDGDRYRWESLQPETRMMGPGVRGG